MAISDEDIRKVRDASDIVAVFSDRVPVRQKGRDFWCCCPIHEEKSPSCKLDPASQLWHCFGCGEGGDVFSFIMKADGLSFPDAVHKLAERAHITITDTAAGKPRIAQGHKLRLQEACAAAAAFFHTQLMRGKDEQAQTARGYLAKRGMGGDVPKKWELGYAPGSGTLVAHLRARGFTDKEIVEANLAVRSGSQAKDRFFGRIMFPIKDIQGDAIAFGGRIIGDGQPKYLNSQETPLFHKSEVLFGLDKAKTAMASTGIAVVVEGYTDVIMLHEAGIANAVATLGTALTRAHIRMLSRHAKNRIVYLFDGDEAGQRAADRALEFIDDNMTPEAGRTRIELAAVTLPGGLDPADFVSTHGAGALQELIDQAQSLIAYGIDRRLARYDLTSPEKRSQALADALSLLAPIKDSLLAKDYAVQIAGRVHAREQDVLDKLATLEALRRHLPEDPGSPSEEARTAAAKASLPQAELNRRRFEREFLSLCARYPALGLEHAGTLAQTQWHEAGNSILAESILETLERCPGARAADIVTAAQERLPRAASILTSGVMTEDSTPEQLALFLADELAIGDMDDAVASLNEQLKHPGRLEPSEYEMLFESVVAMQKELAQRREKHSRP